MKSLSFAVVLGVGTIAAGALLGQSQAQNPTGASASLAPVTSPASVGTISGQVTLDDGKPAAGYSIIARSTRYVTPAPAGEAVTDAEGRYRITLDTGLSPRLFGNEPAAPADTQFTVSAEGYEPLYLDPPRRAVTLPLSLALSGVNFRLTTGPQITVRVHDALTGQPVPGVTVKYPVQQFLNNDLRTAGVTDAQGLAVFRVPRLEVGLSLVPPGGSTPTVRTAPGYSFYREIQLPQIQDVVWDVKTYSTTPPTTPTVWRGVVLTQDGHPAGRAKVTVLRLEAEARTTTDKQGRFTLSLPALTPEEYSRNSWDAAFLVEQGNQSAAVTASPESLQGGMTIRLERKPLASYAGTVIGPDGSPEAGVSVSCRGGLTLPAGTGAGIDRYGVTDAQGRFLLSGLPAGRYQVNLGGGPFGPVTLPPSDPGYPFSSSSLTLGDGEQHDFGRITALPADEVLAGQIVSSDGASVSSRIIAIVHGAHTNQMASLDGQGRFRVYHVVREPLMLDLYRIGKNGGTSLGQNSPDLFLKVPVQAGREDVHVALPAGTFPPPAAAVPAAPLPPLVGPPHVSAVYGFTEVAGLWLNYRPDDAAAGPQATRIHVLLTTRFGDSEGQEAIWQGSLTDMDGMQLTLKKYAGVLRDKAGQTLWAGLTREPGDQLSYTVLSNPAKPNFLTLQDKSGRTLWSGATISHGAPVVVVDNFIAVIGPAGRIVWQQPNAGGGIAYRSSDDNSLRHGHGWSGSGPPPGNGVIHFASVPCKAVFQAQDGPVFYSGDLPTLLLTVTGNKHHPGDWDEFVSLPRCVSLFHLKNYRGTVVLHLYDPQGRLIQSSTSTGSF